MTALFVKWWYGEAIANILKYVRAAYIFSADLFSVRICLRTIFDPWKRDVISYEGLTLKQKFEVWSLNLASRFIGAAIKSGTLLGYLLFSLALSLTAALILILWLLYPAVVAYFVYRVFI